MNTSNQKEIDQKYASPLLLLRLVCLFLFWGRAWQHFFWDTPIRALVWDENMFGWVVNSFSDLSWDEFTRSASVDAAIGTMSQAMGWLYVGCGMAALFLTKNRKWLQYFIFLGSFCLLLLSLLYYKEKFYQTGQFFEYTLQWSFPIFLWYWVMSVNNSKNLRAALRVAIALTFMAHGLYAVGYYPVPGEFLDLTIRITGISEASSVLFLQIAGYLDFALAVGVFIPKLQRGFLIYAMIWGFITSIARVWGHFQGELIMESLHTWMHEAFYRMPHWGGPMLLLGWLGNEWWKQLKRWMFKLQA